MESARAPFQFALSTRAGTDCVARMVRAITEQRQTATLLGIDGIRVSSMCLVLSCLGNFARCLAPARCYLSFGSPTRNLLTTCGLTENGCNILLYKEKLESKGTL